MLTTQRALLIGAFALAFVVAFWHLGTAPLVDWDEGSHAKVALDMHTAGEWLVYAMDGTRNPWNTKPPLLFYALIATFRTLGTTELAVRIFPAACFVLLVVATAWFAHRVLSAGAAWATVLLMVTSQSFLFQHFARDGTPDAPLALMLSIAMYALWFGGGAVATVALALAFLTKGLAALQIVPAVVLWAIVAHEPRVLRMLPVVVTIALVPVAGWIAMREAAAPGFVSDMMRNDLLGRATQVVGAPHARPSLYLEGVVDDFSRIAVALVVLLGCGYGLLADALQTRIPGQARRLAAFLACWWLVPLAFFSAAQTKHEWYVLPSYVPAYVLAGWFAAAGLVALAARAHPKRPAVPIAVVGVAALALVSGKTVSNLFKHHPVEAAARRSELDRMLGSIARPGTPCAVAVFRAHEIPATRFYLTRAGVTYRAFDTWSVSTLAAETRWCIVTHSDSRADLARTASTVRMLDEFPRLRLTLLAIERDDGR